MNAQGVRGIGRTERFLDEITREFPTFRIRKKRESAVQWLIHAVLACVTLGGQRVYVSRYHTVLFGTLWVPDAWDHMTDSERYILLRHERVHLRQRARMGDVVMTFVYLVPFFPLFLAWGRARIEWEAYVETIRATAEVQGLDAAAALRAQLVQRFVGGDYGWMWPFPKTINAWFDEALANAKAEFGG